MKHGVDAVMEIWDHRCVPCVVVQDTVTQHHQDQVRGGVCYYRLIRIGPGDGLGPREPTSRGCSSRRTKLRSTTLGISPQVQLLAACALLDARGGSALTTGFQLPNADEVEVGSGMEAEV